MTTNGTLAEAMVSSLSTDTQFSDITFVVAYENEIKPTPINKPIVAISVKGCEIGEKLSETLDTGEIKVTDKREMNTTLSADIYLPYLWVEVQDTRFLTELQLIFCLPKSTIFQNPSAITQIMTVIAKR